MCKSKKGVTLVELVICCIIMVLLAGACTAVLVSGQRLFISGSQTANNQLEANLLQTTILKALPSMIKVETKTVEEAKGATEGVSIFFDASNDNALTIRQKDSNITVNQVSGLTYEFKKVGKDDGDAATPDTSRAQFVYTATLTDGSTVSGGVVLTNTKYTDVVAAGFSGSIDLKTSANAIYFSVPAEEAGT